MRYSSVLGLALALVPSVLAQCGQISYYPNSGFAQGCAPPGFFQQQAIRANSVDAVDSMCQSGCTNLANQCGSYVLQSTADGSSGTCFYYAKGNTPTGSVSCSNPPARLRAAIKDDSLSCFSTSRSAAAVYCSSVLMVPAKTTTTTTSPTVVLTSTGTTTTQTTSTTSLTSRTTTLTTTTTSTTSTLTTSTTTSTTSTITSVTTTTTTSNGPAPLVKRAIPSNGAQPPACLDRNLPLSRLSSACSCLRFAMSSTTTTTTAPTATSTTQTTTISTSATTTTASTATTATSTLTSTFSTISTTSGTLTVRTTTTTSTTSTSQTACPTGQSVCNNGCTNTMFDDANCGACGNACGQNKYCSRGQCYPFTPCNNPVANNCNGGSSPCSGTVNACSCVFTTRGPICITTVDGCKAACKSDGDCAAGERCWITDCCPPTNTTCIPLVNIQSCVNPSNTKRLFMRDNKMAGKPGRKVKA